MSSCNSADIRYTKNDHYWQPGLPKIETVNFPSYLSKTSANQDLSSGVDQWGSQFIPNIEQVLYSGQPEYYHYWFAPVYSVMHLAQPDRPADSDCCPSGDRLRDQPSPVGKIGEYGEEPGSNQTDIVTADVLQLVRQVLAAKYGNAYAYNPKRPSRSSRGRVQKGG